MRVLLVFVLVLATSVAAHTVQPQSPGFDVASIRRSPDVANRMVSPSVEFLPGGVWRARDATVRTLIRSLYPHQAAWEIVGGPDWISRDFYDIEARAAATAGPEDVRAMARKLLADRFRLEVHSETRQMPAYVLMLPKGRRLGSGFTKPAVDCAIFRAGGERPRDDTRQPFFDRLACARVVMPTSERTLKVPGTNLRLSAGDATLKEVTPLLGSVLGRPVVDQTGITDRFDIELQFSTQPLTTTTIDVGPAPRAAISEQLGLVTEDSRAPIEVLVIERVERPSEN